MNLKRYRRELAESRKEIADLRVRLEKCQTTLIEMKQMEIDITVRLSS